MTKSVRELLKGDTLILHEGGAETVTGNSGPIAISNLKSLTTSFGCVVLDITAKSGTTPTLDVTIVNVDPVSGKEDTIVTFAQQNDIATLWDYTLDSNKKLGNHIKAIWTIGGTTPSFTFTLSMHLKP